MEGYDYGTNRIMVIGKTYLSVGVVLVVGAILYLFRATRIGPKDRDVVLQQSISMDYVKGKILHDLSHSLEVASENDVDKTPKVTDIKNVNVEPSPFRHKNQVQVDITPNEILAKEKVDLLSDSPIKVNKIIKEIGSQHSDGRSPTLPSMKLENPESDVPNWGPNYKNITILSNKKIVIIVAYMRTGSTLTASVFKQYTGTFYAFEPFRSLYEAFKELIKGSKIYTRLKYVHGKNRKYTLSEMDQLRIDEINSWLTCRLDLLSIESLMGHFHEYCSVKEQMTSYSRSRQGTADVNTHSHLRKYYYRSKGIVACLKTAIGYCQRAPLLILKFIRLDMKEVIPLLPLYPNMKIIHLVRDPRGIYNSRFKVHATSPKRYKEHVQKHCPLVVNDLEYSKRILEKYKDKLKILRYEDMAESPIETSRSLAEFAGIEFLKPMQDFIRKQTRSPRDTYAYCTQRRNSIVTAYKWRTQLDPDYARYIFDTCKVSNRILGYLPLSTTKMKHSKSPSRKIVDVDEELLKSNIF